MQEKHYSNAYRTPVHDVSLAEHQKSILSLPFEGEGIPRMRSSQLLSLQHLPTPLTPLIGREREVEAICALLQQPEVRLLTLTGPGGVGKTRLALQIPVEVRSIFADGICFVSLASVCASDLVPLAIAQALGLSENAASRSLAQIQALIRDRNFLLLLDNFEHLADAASSLKELLAACPRLKILITSRTVLELLEELVFYVAPLALPDLANLPSCEDLFQVAAVSLFLQRSRTTCPNFELTCDNARAIAQICVRLDGLPLALELAANRMKLFSPQNLLARLDHRLSLLTSGTRDAPERQQTLRKTMEWSYQLLTAEEKRLFRLLSVFAGSCSLCAIEAISGALERQNESLLDTLTSLLNQSLLQREAHTGRREQRFSMLETTREYALECLQDNNEEEMVRQAHAEYYLALAKTLEAETAEGKLDGWIEKIESEFENLRVAFDRFLAPGNSQRVHQEESVGPIARCMGIMGVIAAQQKHYTRAVCLWGKAHALCQAENGRSQPGPYEWLGALLGTHGPYARVVETARAQLGEQTFAALWSTGRTMELKRVFAGPDVSIITVAPPSAARARVPYTDGLTPREREVLSLLAQGMKSALIADRLVISLVTVNSHVRTIYSKLGVSSRSAATRYALEHHLV